MALLSLRDAAWRAYEVAFKLPEGHVNKLVGRQKELDTIDESLAALATGQGGTLFLSGEPGSGKSTLARVLAEKARSQGYSVYWGFCWESGGAPAYWPWTQVMRPLVSDVDVQDEL